MAQIERQQENKRANKREKSKEARSRRASAGGDFHMTADHWVMVNALILLFMNADGAVRVGRTRDGGALALGCYAGDDYATEYIRPAEDFFAAMQEIAEAWQEDGGQRYAEILATLLPGQER